MGNIASNIFKQELSNEEYTSKLEEVCDELFGGAVTIEFYDEDGPYWDIGPKPELLSSDKEEHRYRYSWGTYRLKPKEFGGKYPLTEWGIWMMHAIQNKLALNNDALCADEGISEVLEGKPDWCPTYLDWIEKRMGNHPKVVRELIKKHYVNTVPKPLLDIK